jgi:hypothetical protein
MNLVQYLRKADREDTWNEEEAAVLGTMLDGKVAKKIKRSIQAVWLKREKLGIPNPSKSPSVGPRPRWTTEEDEIALSLPAEVVARRTGRTVRAVYNCCYQLTLRSRGK